MKFIYKEIPITYTCLFWVLTIFWAITRSWDIQLEKFNYEILEKDFSHIESTFMIPKSWHCHQGILRNTYLSHPIHLVRATRYSCCLTRAVAPFLSYLNGTILIGRHSSLSSFLILKSTYSSVKFLGYKWHPGSQSRALFCHLGQNCNQHISRICEALGWMSYTCPAH